MTGKKSALTLIIFILVVSIIAFLCINELKNDKKKLEQNEQEEIENVVLGADILDNYKIFEDEIKKGNVKFIVLDREKNEVAYSDYDKLNADIYKYERYVEREKEVDGKNIYIYEVENYNNLDISLQNNQQEEIKETKKRDLLEGQVYGSNLIDNYKSHKENIDSGVIEFNVISEDNTVKKYTSIQELEGDINVEDVYSKSFEIDELGNLKKYIFTKIP